MPELPEVETIRRQLEKEIVGEEISDIWYDRAKMLKPSPEVFITGVKGRKISGVKRRAKLLIFELSNDSSHSELVSESKKTLKQVQGDVNGTSGYFVVHLRLSGRLLVREKKDLADDYVHAIFKFKSGRELRFAEARLFGYAQYLESKEELGKILDKYGPEPLDDLDKETFSQILKKTRRPIKLVLLDQEKISGIGNIYASEALWVAKTNPQQPANSLTAEQSERLLEAIEQVLREGLETGGASDQWYRNAYGEKGSYQKHFKVYGKAGEPCSECGVAIKRIELGGRGTFFCPKCQPH